LISDDIDEIKRVYRLCSDNGYVFYFFNSASASLEFLLNENIDVVIVRQEYIDDPVGFLENTRNNNLNTSYIFIGDNNCCQVKNLLKSGYYDYLFNDYQIEELGKSIEEAIENKNTFEKVKAISLELEKTNLQLLEKTRELEMDKNRLNSVISKFERIEAFIKEINMFSSMDDIFSKTTEYLSKVFVNNKIITTLIDGYVETAIETSGEGVKSFKGMVWDLKDIKTSPWAESIIKTKVRVDVKDPMHDVWYKNVNFSRVMPYGFIKCPVYYGDTTFGTVVISYEKGKPYFEEDQIFYLNLIIEHTAIHIFNKRLNEELKRTIEQLENYQQQMVEKEKLSTLAKVAVSVNHEINNPLCAISLNAELIKRKYKDDENLQKIIDSILKNVTIINKITNRFVNLRKVTFKEYLPGIEMLDLGEDS
jgi:DNA-binding response OmpR family regulator